MKNIVDMVCREQEKLTGHIIDNERVRVILATLSNDVAAASSGNGDELIVVSVVLRMIAKDREQ